MVPRIAGDVNRPAPLRAPIHPAAMGTGGPARAPPLPDQLVWPGGPASDAFSRRWLKA